VAGVPSDLSPNREQNRSPRIRPCVLLLDRLSVDYLLDSYCLSLHDNLISQNIEAVMEAKRIPPVNTRLCRAAAALAAASVIAFIGGNAARWLVPEWTEMAAREASHVQTAPIFITPLVRWVGLGATTLYLGVLVWGLLSMRTLFKRLAAGEVFVADTGVLLRRFGTALLVYAALTPVVAAGLSMLVTRDPVNGGAVLSVGISHQEITVALIGALILVFGSVMADATRIADENREII
jgi:hypothetical protein